MKNWKIIKNGHSEDNTLGTSKPGNLNSLRGDNLYYEAATLKLIDEATSQYQNKLL